MFAGLVKIFDGGFKIVGGVDCGLSWSKEKFYGVFALGDEGFAGTARAETDLARKTLFIPNEVGVISVEGSVEKGETENVNEREVEIDRHSFFDFGEG